MELLSMWEVKLVAIISAQIWRYAGKVWMAITECPRRGPPIITAIGARTQRLTFNR
jgi:hypothetical protein